MLKYLFYIFLLFFSASCDSSKETATTETTTVKFTSAVLNKTAYIPPQCYTDIENSDKSTQEKIKNFNPCYACHTTGQEPNYIDDSSLQTDYTFITDAKTNHWKNLFKDRTEAVNQISSEEIQKYIREDNYKNLADNLKNLKNSDWDFNKNGTWDGFIPDCEFNFDENGFDKKSDGTFTGWRAFAYFPFLGTFFPTNGSTDDVLIRLPKEFQTDENSSTFNLEVYRLNLAILETIISQDEVALSFEIDENRYSLDLNGDSIFSKVQNITPHQNLKFVGNAKSKKIDFGLFPKETEFLHSVRYIDFDENGDLKLSNRMKELRYSKKTSYLTYSDWQIYTIGWNREAIEDNDDPKIINGNFETGLNNGLGWIYSGFIEDQNGNLRPQTQEETTFCIGCHSSIGATTDTTFAFKRKFKSTSTNENWYHWSQKTEAFQNIADSNLEYTKYLEKNPFGDEFRENEEVFNKFYNSDLNKKTEAFEILKNDISHLLIPTKNRAEILNKAYKLIVNEQSFIFGRDSTISPAKNIFEKIN